MLERRADAARRGGAMRGWSVWGAGLAVVVATAAPAAAQEQGDVGVTLGYPAGVGVIWHIADRVAIRPDVSFTWTSTESTTSTQLLPGLPPTTITSSADLFNTAVGVSVLVYLSSEQPFRLYLVPRAAYIHTSLDLDGSAGTSLALDEETDGYLLSGALGGQFKAHDRFSIFGELGLQYTSQGSSQSIGIGTNESESRSLGLRSAVGVVLYF
jgi:hypothetical protein